MLISYTFVAAAKMMSVSSSKMAQRLQFEEETQEPAWSFWAKVGGSAKITFGEEGPALTSDTFSDELASFLVDLEG